MRKPPRLPSLPKPGKLPIKSTARRTVKAGAALASTDKRGNIEAHTFDPKTGHLDVTFHGGRQYRYAGVSEETAQKLSDAGSAGAFLRSHVIGKHDVTKL